MSRGQDDRSVRFVGWWVQRYTAGLPDPVGASRRAEIDSDLVEHAHQRAVDGWNPKQIARERMLRLFRGVLADLSWRHEVITGTCRVRDLVRVSVTSVTSIAALMLAMFHFAFAAYLLGDTSLAERRFLGGIDNYADEVGRPVASVLAALVIGGLGLVLLVSGLARPVAPVVANAATIAVAAIAALFFWLGVWPVALVAVAGASADLALRTPQPTRRP